jgi:putative salt-induced outer membrane protein YdiY
MNASKYLAGLCLGLFLIPALVSATESEEADTVQDEILLKSGSRILGTVTGARGGVVTIDTDFAGTLSIELEKIESLKTSDPVLIQLADETVVSEQPLVIQDELLVIETATDSGESYATSDLLRVNPEPWELGQGYKWSGLASLAWSAQRGNTDTDELDYNLESKWRSKEDRYTLRYNGENDRTNGESTVKKWYAQGKYDYFFDGPNYGGIQAYAEHDKFTDLDLRYVVGPFIGRQFYEEPIFTFSGEVGLSYVNEDFVVAEDNDYPAATWALNASSNYLGGDSRLYFDNRGIWNLDETSDYVVNTTFGLAFPLLWSLEAAAEILLDYDSGAVNDVDELDQTYRFRVGYTW